MSKLKQIFKNKRVIILIIALIISVYAINPSFTEGVIIRGVAKDSAAAHAQPKGFISPSPTAKPMSREVIKTINGKPILTVADYFDATKNLEINQTITIKTNRNLYYVDVKPDILNLTLNKTETLEYNKTIFNTTINDTQVVTIIEQKNKTKEIVLGPEDIGLTVYQRPSNNIQRGIDLQGGTRVLLEPEDKLTKEQMEIVLENINQRLNVFGVSDVTVKTTNDFLGNTFITVEIPGVNEDEVKALLKQEGKFEAKVDGQTIFGGGKKDILSVCMTGQCSYVDQTCQESTNSDGENEYSCGFFFSMTISQAAAERQYAALVNSIDLGTHLNKNISLYLDGEFIEALTYQDEFKEAPITNSQIRGSAQGPTAKAARENAVNEMKTLQSVLVSGSLPTKLKFANTYTISPILGAKFIKNATYAGLLAILVVIMFVAIRYKEWRISLPMGISMISEVVILLGFSALISHKIDIVAVAAIIIAIGSGVDDAVVITDETLAQGKKKLENYDWQQKIKKAFFIIFASYFTLVVAMVPLAFVESVKGFAITTIAGVTIGVLITRPAFAQMLEIIIGD